MQHYYGFRPISLIFLLLLRSVGVKWGRAGDRPAGIRGFEDGSAISYCRFRRGERFGASKKSDMGTLVIRPANKSDSRIIAEFNRISSGGVCEYIWQEMAKPGDDLLDIGQKRFEREYADISYRNASVVEDEGTVVGMLLAYKMLIDPDSVPSDPVLKPYSILEEEESYHVAAMAVNEAHRGRGIGSRLLALAEAQAGKIGLGKLSLIVMEKNTAAKRLYERNGYAVTMREATVPHPLIHHEGDALLMVKHLKT